MVLQVDNGKEPPTPKTNHLEGFLDASSSGPLPLDMVLATFGADLDMQITDVCQIYAGSPSSHVPIECCEVSKSEYPQCSKFNESTLHEDGLIISSHAPHECTPPKQQSDEHNVDEDVHSISSDSDEESAPEVHVPESETLEVLNLWLMMLLLAELV